MREKMFKTFTDAQSYAYHYKEYFTITKYGDKYIVSMDPVREYESPSDRKSRLRDEKINSILGE